MVHDKGLIALCGEMTSDEKSLKDNFRGEEKYESDRYLMRQERERAQDEMSARV